MQGLLPGLIFTHNGSDGLVEQCEKNKDGGGIHLAEAVHEEGGDNEQYQFEKEQQRLAQPRFRPGRRKKAPEDGGAYGRNDGKNVLENVIVGNVISPISQQYKHGDLDKKSQQRIYYPDFLHSTHVRPKITNFR
jgi:hypothetical protein